MADNKISALNALTVPASGDLFAIVDISANETKMMAYSDLAAAVGGSFQPLDATLTALAGLTITANSLIYGTGADAFAVLAQNTTGTRKFLREVSSGAPAWDTVTATDVGLSNVENTALSTWGGSGSITQVGTVGSGTWNGDIIAPQYGGTGVDNANRTITLTNKNITFDSSGDALVLTITQNAEIGWVGAIVDSQHGGTGVDNGGRTITILTDNASFNFGGAVTLTVAATASISGTNTGDQTTVSGNAGTATALQTPRNINGVAFDGTGNITVAAAAGTLTGATLAAGVLASSLTSVGTLTGGTWNATVIDSTYGGTGVNNGGRTLTISGNNGTINFGSIGVTLNIGASATITGGSHSGTNTGDQTNISGNAATVTTNANLTGDVTSVGNATTIGANKVTLTMVADIATRSVMGRNTAGTGDPEVITNFPVGVLIHATGGGNTVGATTTTYGEFGFGNSLSTTETSRQTTMPFACTIRNLYVRTLTAQPAGNAMVITMRKNAGATILTTTIAGGAAAGTFSDLTNSFTVVAGDRVSIEFANANAGTSANVLEVVCGMVF